MNLWEQISNVMMVNVPLNEAPLLIQNGAKFYIEPNQAEFNVLSVVYDILDEERTPRVVINMPYWTRGVNPRTGESEIDFYAGVNVMNLAGGNQDNTLPVSRYALMHPQPVVSQRVVNWISTR